MQVNHETHKPRETLKALRVGHWNLDQLFSLSASLAFQHFRISAFYPTTVRLKAVEFQSAREDGLRVCGVVLRK
jgi:hypothetical protein